MHPELERLLGAVPGGELSEVSLDDLRGRRATAQQLEEVVSYLRRIIQVRLDILGTELRHRYTGGVPSDSSDLVARLPEILSEHPGGTASPRAPRQLEVPDVDSALMAAVDSIVPTSKLVELDQIDDPTLASLVDQLNTLEVEVSATRRHLHERIDHLQEEVARRYRSGQAPASSLFE